MNYELAISEEAGIREAINRIFCEEGRVRKGSLFDEDGLGIILDDIFSLMKQGKSLYQRWTQRVDNKDRQLSVPNKPLRRFLESYLLDFIKQQEVHERCHGGEAGWSPKTSLETHLPCSCALSFDLRSAFENVSYEKVYDFFYRNLGNLSEEEKEKVARFLSLLCTVRYSERKGLPQGSPASMALFNRILLPLDCQLNQKAGKKGLKYSRWVDDITISSQEYRKPEFFLGAVELTARDFPVASEKIFFQGADLIYLLGYKITGMQISKNTREEKERNKTKPLNFDEWFFGDRRYETWN